MSIKDLDRLEVLKKTLNKELTQEEAGRLLKIGSRQIRKLLLRLKQEGPSGIVSRLIGKRGNRNKPLIFKHQVFKLLKEKYEGFGPTLAAEKLLEDEGLILSRETIRQWMMEHNLWIQRKKKKKFHLPRLRRAFFGELIQGDGSPFRWFGDDLPEANATVLIDDATSTITGLFFSETETLEAYYSALEMHFENYGLPRALYTDHYTVFYTSKKTGETQMQRALKELGIELILANSPQAKGRVERANRVLQDRLAKEFRLRGITTIEEANAYVPEYIKKHNQLFSKKPMSACDAHRPLEGYDLHRILCRKEVRILNSCAVFTLNNVCYQVQGVSEIRRLNKKKVEIRHTRTGEIRVFLEDKEVQVLPLSQIMEQPKELDKKEIDSWKSNPHKVALTHPWKIGLQREIVRKRMTMI